MDISGSRLRELLVLSWTVFTAMAALFYSFVYFAVPEHRSPLKLGLVSFHGRAAVWIAVFVGIWGFAAAVLLLLSPRVGAWLLLVYSFCAFVTLGGWLVLDSLFVFHYPIDWITQLGQLAAVIAFLAMTLWCWRRAVPSGASEISISLDRSSGAGSNR